MKVFILAFDIPDFGVSFKSFSTKDKAFKYLEENELGSLVSTIGEEGYYSEDDWSVSLHENILDEINEEVL